ncbi:snare associated Golgi protein-domain-containing protein [Epithele typhae]|uniref:snare associated Golgi protein-domain-containing protein n=1 Tax=Epithele typhae TaxID=378194 RepID=UPI002007C44A|nr:snare associated Golgi protein-domain-containing protein [Epithele typhae]KAH9925871.1 snare associated Golgi protein-domain-containing protein [Epithele typhae]
MSPPPLFVPQPARGGFAPQYGYPPPVHAGYDPYLEPTAQSYVRPSSDVVAPLNPPHGGYKGNQIPVDYRVAAARTPSPTPSEADALTDKQRKSKGLRQYLNAEWLKEPRNLFTAVVTLVLIGAVIAFVALQSTIINAMKPATNWLLNTPGAWTVPIGIMIILSFPPLFGHELVALFTGVVWGPWVGFGIVAAGTILGELCTYFAFKYCCSKRAQKQEEKNLKYALTAEVIREGGLLIAIIVRYSALPGHMATAMFATCGMSVWTFFLATFISLPKQFAAVYLGYSENVSKDDANSKHTKVVKIVVITATVLVTIFAMRFINARIEAIKVGFIYRRRKARQAKLSAGRE